MKITEKKEKEHKIKESQDSIIKDHFLFHIIFINKICFLMQKMTQS